ncbi:hypothetical protein ID866_1367 [Astraeus odoratus]|nr:hypothetical protein ID866_1367 [Astraeus odoratus]
MGIGTGTRRVAARGTNLKTKLPIETVRSASPLPGSDNGNISDDNTNGKIKAKSKARFTTNVSCKEVEKSKNHGFGRFSFESWNGRYYYREPGWLRRPHHRTQPYSDKTLQVPTSSQSKVPSKLRSSSTASFLERDRSATPASQSSVGTPIATSTSSALSVQSPAGTGPPKRGRPKGSKTGMGRGAATQAAQVKRPSPPRPPPPPPPPPPQTDYLIGAFLPDSYFQESGDNYPDVEGEETGSSTDTD